MARPLPDISAPGFFDDLPKPLFWRVLIMPDQPKNQSEGGILLPDQTQDAEKYLNYVGKLVAKGDLAFTDDRLKEDKSLPRVGDYVVFGRYAGQVVKYKEVRLLLMNDDEILAVARNRDALKIHVE